MQCPSCGVKNAKSQSFCKSCGAALFSEDQQPRLGHYKLTSKLGEGGMGIVYCAHDEKLNREVAIKVLHPHLLQHENLKERFRREARMHAKIIHPNIVTLLSLYEDGEHMALVMEMVHGQNLKQYLRQHPRLGLMDIIRIAEAVLSGLEAAHKLGVVHRDLKPANVLISSTGDIKLMDFGLAKPKRGDDDLTQSGATVGSFRYMAPEQILNQPIDARTDLYAFGILLYQMCTGKLPFDASVNGGGEFEIMEKQVREDPTPPHQINPALPPPLSELIMGLLAKNMADRPASCEVVHQSLLQISKQAERQRTASAITMPRPGKEDDSIEIAKGLASAFTRRVRRILIDKPWSWLKSGLSALRLPQRLHAPLTWGALLLFIAILGWVLTSVIHLAERPPATDMQVARSTQPATTKPAAATTAKKPAPAVQPAPVSVAPKPVKKPAAKKPAPVKKAKAKPKKSKAKPKAKKTTTRRSITYRVGHKVVRSDGSKAGPRDWHEFRGGKHLYFQSLAKYRWKDKLRTSKKGFVRLYFDKPVRLSRIVIHRASVGRLSFAGGEIRLEVQDSRGRWTDLLVRKDRDIDSALTIRGPKKALAGVKGVRLRFKSAEPITIGPIDLIP